MLSTAAMPRSWSQAAFRRCRSSSASKRLSTTTARGRAPANGATERRTALIVPSPASATSTTWSGATRGDEVDARRRRSAIGDRGPPTVSTRPTSTSGSGQRELVERGRRASGTGRPRTAAAIGGAIGHRVGARRRAHDVAGLAGGVASTSASSGCAVVRVEGLRGLAGRHGAAPARGGRRARRRPTQVLPTSVAVPAQTTSIRRTRASASVGQRLHQPLDLLVGVGGRQRDAQAAGARRDGRGADGGDEQALLEQARPTRRAPPPRRRARSGTIGDGWPGRDRVDVAAQPRDQRVALARPHDPQRGQGGGGVAGGGRGGEDERAGRVDQQVDDVALGRRRSPPSEPSVFDSVPTRTTVDVEPARRSGPSTAWASSRTSSAPCRRHTSAELVDRRLVAVHGEHGVGDDERGPGVGGERARRRGRRRRGGRPRPGRGPSGHRR